MLLYWKLHGSIQFPSGSDTSTKMMFLIRSWCLADKYNIPRFQDLVMLELLKITQKKFVTYGMVKVAFENTPDQSPLRKFMAKEAAIRYYELDHRNTSNLDILDGVQGFVGEFMVWINYKHDENNDEGDASGLYTDLKDPDDWENYMVGGGAFKHWLYEDEN